jgi:ribosomal protein S6--L-glutamate ligase
VVIKLLEGTQGIGVILAPSNRVAEAIVETLHSTQQNVLIQQFVAESKGRDIRALVVGDRVVAAMRRSAQGDEFRSNVHRGGSTESIAITAEYERTAVRAAQIMGLRVAGVDMLEGADGPLVMEVNSSPGLEGIETATGLDVAGAIVDYIANQVAFPELDVRQRLTVSTGSGVAELQVREDAELVGTSIRKSGLRERDITVLTLHRGTEVIPNPRESRELEAGDRLLCFGKLEAMRDMIPARKKRRARVRKLPEDPLAGGEPAEAEAGGRRA